MITRTSDKAFLVSLNAMFPKKLPLNIWLIFLMGGWIPGPRPSDSVPGPRHPLNFNFLFHEFLSNINSNIKCLKYCDFVTSVYHFQSVKSLVE